MDTATAKNLLQTGTLQELQDAVLEAASSRQRSLSEEEAANQEQRVKLEILLHSKIFQLQADQPGQQSATCTELGRLWMELDDMPKAIGQLEKAVALDSDNFQAFLLLADTVCVAVATSKAGDVATSQEKATQYIETAIGILETRNKPVECAQAYCKLASLSEKQSNFAQAIAVLEGAIPKCCTDSSITDEANIQEHCTVVLYGTLGRLKEIAGDYEGAVVNLRQALPACQVLHGPDHPQTQELAYLLEMAESVL